MGLLGFLEGTGTDHRGRRIDDILAFSDPELETVHDFIQWLFPLPEASAFNAFAPILAADDIAAVRESPLAKQNLDRAAERMLRFYRNSDHWLSPVDHNHLRITRILRSLGLLVNRARAEQFLSAIEARVDAAGSPVSSRSRDYWRRAVLASPSERQND
jgi:hypothetical protein